MKNNEIKKFSLSLAKVDTEKEVINILEKAGYWYDDSVWCEYGDDPMNYSTIGNQQSSPDNALVEKLVNSVDAILMRECLKQGIEPSSNKAPQSIAEAQNQFFDIYNGKLSSIDERQRTRLAENIFLVATGGKTKPSLSIIDKGEGQSPKHIPETILSLTKDNKIKTPFVQGKFGMGGSGVLRFCSPENSVLLVISKRNGDINKETDEKIYGEDETRDLWSITVVRREDPKSGDKSSHYTYLAPKGKVLSFEARDLPLLPGPHPEVFSKPLTSGTYIKLYEYEIGTGLRSFIGFDLYYRLALLMPDVALPIRMAERREYKAHSHDKTLAGLSVRLDEDKSENLEPEFQTPSTGEMTVEGQKLDYSIYVFKKGKKENYAKSEGVIFSINGQTHGFLQKEFFERKKAGKMSYLSNSILVTIDCSKMLSRKQEKLFMPSRDRLSYATIRYSIERELEDIVKNHSGLRELRNRRRKEAIEGKLQDSKPLANILENIIKQSPTLSSLFLKGVRIRNPFNMENVANKKEFKGKKFPTYFNPVKDYTEKKPKHSPINHKFRVQYETDAENNYFNRDQYPGKLTLKLNGEAIQNYSLNLWNGLATLTISIPKNAKIGEILCFEIELNDIDQINPFSSKFCIHIEKESNTNGFGGKRKSPPDDKKGSDRKKESYLDIPNVIEIRKEDWVKAEYKEFNFDEYSALKIRSAEAENCYDFFINIDNMYLKTEMKGNIKDDPAILEARYRYGMVLLGISILDFEENRHKDKKENVTTEFNKNGLSIYDQISQLTEAVSPTLLPMIASLGGSEFEV